MRRELRLEVDENAKEMGKPKAVKPNLTTREAALEEKVAALEELVEGLTDSVDTLTKECEELKAALDVAIKQTDDLTEKVTGAKEMLEEEREEKMKYWEALTYERNLVRVLEGAANGDMEYAGFSQQPYLCDRVE